MLDLRQSPMSRLSTALPSRKRGVRQSRALERCMCFPGIQPILLFFICLVTILPDASLSSVLPQAPTRLAIHEKTPSSVMLRWEGDMNSVEPIRSYIIEYQIVNKGKGGEYKRSDVMELKTGGTRPFYQVTNLKPYTTYIFKVIAENSVGRSRPSNAEEATTAEI
ncbi:receptor-type tyrosine-protein phosphatase F, partial [Biomphalaria glabrata]